MDFAVVEAQFVKSSVRPHSPAIAVGWQHAYGSGSKSSPLLSSGDRNDRVVPLWVCSGCTVVRLVGLGMHPGVLACGWLNSDAKPPKRLVSLLSEP